jgi:hypothetical protein
MTCGIRGVEGTNSSTWLPPMTFESVGLRAVRASPLAALSAIKVECSNWFSPHYWFLKNILWFATSLRRRRQHSGQCQSNFFIPDRQRRGALTPRTNCGTTAQRSNRFRAPMAAIKTVASNGLLRKQSAPALIARDRMFFGERRDENHGHGALLSIQDVL